jgi:signal transduction histidine kinase
MHKLFKAYSSASDEHHRVYGGTGLGLWISKVIVELMGGSINCSSEIGTGTTFSIEIPIQYFKNEQREN